MVQRPQPRAGKTVDHERAVDPRGTGNPGMIDGEPTGAPAPLPGIDGSDRWHTMAGAEWSFWDLWFCTVCVADHEGDWDALDAAIQRSQRWCNEGLWCHLVDLTARLDAAGLTAADLPAACPTRRGLLPKARTKVLKSTPGRRELSPPMRDLPSVRLYRRALFGAWEHFPGRPGPGTNPWKSSSTLRGGRTGMVGPLRRVVWVQANPGM